jgi:glycosyltransferase involved in cell wall biosynthesis
MRVANILEEGKMGGPQVRILQVAVYLEKHVDTVVVMPEENSAEFQQCCESLGVPFQALPLSRITKELGPALRYLWRTPWEILQLVRLFHQERFDLIHVSGGSWQYKGTIAGKLAGTPVIWHLNDTYMPRPLRRVFGLLSGLACGYAYASERTKAYYAPYVSSNKFEFTIPAPVDTTRFDPKLELPDDALYSELEGRKVVGTVANLSPVKDLITFLKMAAKLQQQSETHVALVVVGKLYETQRSYFHTLEEVAKQLQLMVYWAGPRQDVRPLLKRFDVYVCSSIAESSPISVWEAMSMAKPIVSTDVGDVPLYVNNQENGFVVPVGDSEKMASRVLELINDGEMRKRFGLRSRKVAQQHLDIARCGERHLQAYQQIHSSQHKQLLC